MSFLPDASKMYLTPIGCFNQETDVDDFVVEALWRLFVHEANYRLDLDLYAFKRLDGL